MNNATNQLNELDLEKQLVNLTQLYRQAQQELDVKNQQIYSQERELGRLKCLESEYLQEIDALQNNEKVNTAKYNTQLHDFKEQITSFKARHLEELEQKKFELVEKDTQIEELQSLVKTLQDGSGADTDVMNDLNNENIHLKECVDKLSERIEHLTSANEEVEKQYSHAQDTIIDLRKEITQFQESYICQKEELHEANCLVLNLQEENATIKTELEILKSNPLNSESQGNSLFAEVDDRRMQLQQIIDEMKVKYKKMQKERTAHMRQISELKLQLSAFYQQQSDQLKVNEEKENDEERLERSTKNRINMMEALMNSYKKEILELQEAKEKDLGNNCAIEYVKMMTKNKNKEIENLRDRIDNLSSSHLLLCHQIKDANAESQKWKAEAMRFQCKVYQIESELDNLKISTEKISDIDSFVSSENTCGNFKVEKMVLHDYTKEEGNKKISNIDMSRQIRKSKTGKENIEGSNANKELQKKVQFSEDTVGPATTSRNRLPMGGKLLQVQTIHIPSIKKKAM